MEELRESDIHPFEQFKVATRKLVTVSKAELDAKLKEHNETKTERRAGRKSEQNQVSLKTADHKQGDLRFAIATIYT